MNSHSLQFIFAILLFSIWFLAILALQINIVYGLAVGRNLRWLTFWSRWDVLHLCPNFAFFSRLPTIHYQILIRDQLVDGEYSAWQLVALRKRSFANAVWNPGRRRRFAVEDACRSLVGEVSRRLNVEKKADPLCVSFICLLNYAAAEPKSAFTRARQFMIAATQTLQSKGPVPVFVSPLFLLDMDSFPTSKNFASEA